MRLPLSLPAVVCLALCSCATVTTTISSTISSADLPPDKYRKIVVFIENDDADRGAFERSIVAGLHSAGVVSESSVVLFNNSRTTADPAEQAQTIRGQGFDAALYVTIVQKALVQEATVNMWMAQDEAGDAMVCSGSAANYFCYSMPSWYALAQDGNLVKLTLTLVTKSELQDVRSAKLVWTADASVFADGTDFDTMPGLFDKIARQISEKMKSDHAI
jgi:hypothetical protein